MDSSIIGVLLLVAAILLAIHSVFGRIFGFHRSMPWSGGGQVTFVGEISLAGFLGSAGSALTFNQPAFIVAALPFWLIGYISQSRANHRFRREEKRLRDNNAKLHPGIFDVDPPQSLDVEATPLVDVYDCVSCAFIGRIGSASIRDLIQATADVPDQGPNDLFVVAEMLELLELPPSNELDALLTSYLDSRGHAILRWFPVERATKHRRIERS